MKNLTNLLTINYVVPTTKIIYFRPTRCVLHKHLANFNGLTFTGNPAATHASNNASRVSWFVRVLIPVKYLISSCVIFPS